MSVTSVSTNSNITFSPLDSNNAVRLLEKQKAQLQEQIQKVNESKLDDKIKQERVKQLQDQVKQIDMEIQQKRTEELNQKQNTNEQKVNNQPNGDFRSSDNNLAGMPDLIQASFTYSEAKIMNGIKNSLKNGGRILKNEIEIDEGSSLSGCKAVVKRQELRKMESGERALDKKISEDIKTIQDKVKQASTKENENNTNAENKDIENNNILNTAKISNPEAKNIKSAENGKAADSIEKEIKETGRGYKKVDVRI